MGPTSFDLESTLKTINNAQHYDALWEGLIGYLTAAGADLISYRHVAPPHAPDAGRVDTLTYGYPSAWGKHYIETKLYKHDPLLSAAYLHMVPILWSDILDNPKLDGAEQNFVSRLREWMKGDGYVIPTFGPSGRNGYFGIGNSASIQDWNPELTRNMQWACRQFHLRYTALRLEEIPSEFTLTDQEQSILQSLSRGKGLGAIAMNMNMETHSLLSIYDKLLLKMSVSDLPSLMVRAKSLGLIKTMGRP